MREFKITFSNDVFGLGPDTEIPFVKEGDTRTITPETFNKIKSGETIECGQSMGHGVAGYYNYSKKDLVNEVEETEVIVNRTIRRLGKRTKSEFCTCTKPVPGDNVWSCGNCKKPFKRK